MKMSANEHHQSVDIRLYANRRSNLLQDLEELNRMERPSRVFSSRHHISIPPLLSSMDDNHRRPRESSIIGSLTSSQRMLGTGDVANGDMARNRSSFVNFTITDPETRQVTAAGQIPLHSPPSNSHQTLTTGTDGADSLINVASDDEYIIDESQGHSAAHTRLLEYYNSMNRASRYSRSMRRSRRTTEHPYIVRNDLDNNPSNGRLSNNNRRVRFSSTNRSLSSSPGRQTPEQELPEVEEQEMEPETEEDVTLHEESISSVSSINDADTGDDVSNTQNTTYGFNHLPIITNVQNEIRDYVFIPDPPRTRVVPFIMSPIPLSPQTDSPPDTSNTLATSLNNDVSRASPFIDNNADDRDLDPDVPIINYDGIPDPPPFEYIQFSSVSRSDILNTGLVNRGIGVESNNTVDNTVNRQANDTATTVGDVLGAVDEVIDSTREDNDQLILRPAQPTSVTQREIPSRDTLPEASVGNEDHPETYNDLNDQLTRLFECPVCFEHIVPPIFQCLLGHLICNKCVLLCENCPTCRNPFNSKRNLYMEKVGYLVKFPCRNLVTGCKQQMFFGQKEIHEQACCFRHYQCFFTNCSWKAYYPELHAHMTYNHNNFILRGAEQSLDIMLPNHHQTYKWFLLAHDEYFAIIAHASIPPRRIKVQVNYIGQAVKAKNFKFVISLTQQKDRNDGSTSQKLVYERSTLPYSEIYEMSSNNGLKKDIFSFPSEVLEPYIRKRRRRLPIVLKVLPENNVS